MTQHKNLGVIIEHKPTDFVGGTLPYTIRLPSGDWSKFTPTPEVQASHFADSMACVTFSALNVLETLYKFQTGQEINFSDRFIAKLSGTTPQGNSVQRVLDTINKYGLVLESEWPAPINFTWDEYYADIPPEVMAKARFKNSIQYEFHQPELTTIINELQQVPLQMIIEHDHPYHAQEMINKSQVFDSYPPYIEPQKSIYILTKILFNIQENKEMQLIKDNGTVYLVGKSAKLGIADEKALQTYLDLGETVTDGSTSGIPQVGTVVTGTIIHK